MMRSLVKPRRWIVLLVIMTALGVNLLHAQPERGLLNSSDGAFDGYLLFTPLASNITYLIDNTGALIHSWTLSAPSGQEVYLLENGNLLYSTAITIEPFGSVATATGGAGRIIEMTWDGEEVWSFEYATEEHLHHQDMRLLPNGNLLLVAWEIVSTEAALAAGMNPALIPESGNVWPDTVVEVDRESSEIVWQWRTWDHLVQNYNPTLPNYGSIAAHPERVNVNYIGQRFGSDWQHVNSIDYNAQLDQIVISVRNLNEIWVIDHSTTMEESAGSTGGRSGMGGDILYRWGNPAAYSAGTARDRQLFLAHDAQWITEGLTGAGNLLLYNNGDIDHNRLYSTVTEITPPLNDDGTYALMGRSYLPTAPVWEYAAQPAESFLSRFISSVERLPSGNTLICEGTTGRIFEVTPDGEIVWEYISPYVGGVEVEPFQDNAIFRVSYYPRDYPGLARLE